MDKKHYEVVAAVIVKDNKVYCCQRGNKGECAFKWEFPGGKIELGETKEEALVREIKEELNCKIKVEKYITTIDHEYNTFFITMHVYLCTLIDREPTISEHITYKWCDVSELESLDFAQADYKFLNKIEKIYKAQMDICEIKAALNDINLFNKKSIEIFEKNLHNSDYQKYIILMKSKNKMNGSKLFKDLDYKTRRKVFEILIESIELYIDEEIVENKK